MSIIVFHLVPQGMVFAADRNVTTRVTGRIVRTGQSQRPKVLKWPNRDVAMHYAGQAAMADDQPTDLWLYDFIGRHLDDDLPDIASALCQDLDDARERKEIYSYIVIHLGAFEQQDDDWRPRVWYIHNTEGLDPQSGEYHLGDAFTAEEQIDQKTYFGGKPTNAIRGHLTTKIFQFRQGSDLSSFGVLDDAARAALLVIDSHHPNSPLRLPSTLADWEQRVKFSILAYGAFYAAFYEPYEQYVGGGADAVSLPWPNAL
jgi:hypothetical protein